VSEDDPPLARDAYDQFADSYVTELEDSPYHADLAFPGTMALLPDADGGRVLDAGGFFVFTVPHPFDEYPLGEDEN
jgi:hypothetical protein